MKIPQPGWLRKGSEGTVEDVGDVAGEAVRTDLDEVVGALLGRVVGPDEAARSHDARVVDPEEADALGAIGHRRLTVDELRAGLEGPQGRHRVEGCQLAVRLGQRASPGVAEPALDRRIEGELAHPRLDLGRGTRHRRVELEKTVGDALGRPRATRVRPIAAVPGWLADQVEVGGVERDEPAAVVADELHRTRDAERAALDQAVGGEPGVLFVRVGVHLLIPADDRPVRRPGGGLAKQLDDEVHEALSWFGLWLRNTSAGRGFAPEEVRQSS